MQEFELIKKYFAPLASGFAGSLGLGDDAAVFSVPAGCELVISKDAVCEGVHFIGSEDAALIAGKALRVNLSDLAAMGARPHCYFLALMLPKNTPEAWVASFARGLGETQAEFGIYLAGGDTTSCQGKVAISITVLGTVPSGKALRRSGARVGDYIYVSGTLGDAALGLEMLQCSKEQMCENFLVNRYLLPRPRLSLGAALRGLASSTMDISDGLVQDLGHICAASGVGAVLYAASLPISKQAQQMPGCLQAALSGGDDYELLFTAPPEKAALVPEGCTKIGEITAGSLVQVMGENGEEIALSQKGFVHF